MHILFFTLLLNTKILVKTEFSILHLYSLPNNPSSISFSILFHLKRLKYVLTHALDSLHRVKHCFSGYRLAPSDFLIKKINPCSGFFSLILTIQIPYVSNLTYRLELEFKLLSFSHFLSNNCNQVILMSMRFLTLMRPAMGLLPEVADPTRKVFLV